MPQRKEMSVMLKYVNTILDMKRAISYETGIPITDFYLLNGVNVMLCRTHTPKTIWVWNVLGVGLLTLN